MSVLWLGAVVALLTSRSLPACTAPADSAQALVSRQIRTRRIIAVTRGAGTDRPGRTFPVVTAFSVFLNGLSGVALGIAVLYVLMKLLAVVSDR